MEKLDAPIGLAEINKAINNLQSDSSPGLDRLTPEFYKCFSQALTGPLQDLFNHCILEKTIPPTWRRAKIILINKQGKDLELP